MRVSKENMVLFDAYLAHELSKSQKNEFLDRLERDTDFKAEFEHYQKESAELNEAIELNEFKNQLKGIHQKTFPPKKLFLLRPNFIIATSIAAVVVLGIFMLNNSNFSSSNDNMALEESQGNEDDIAYTIEEETTEEMVEASEYENNITPSENGSEVEQYSEKKELDSFELNSIFDSAQFIGISYSIQALVGLDTDVLEEVKEFNNDLLSKKGIASGFFVGEGIFISYLPNADLGQQFALRNKDNGLLFAQVVLQLKQERISILSTERTSGTTNGSPINFDDKSSNAFKGQNIYFPKINSNQIISGNISLITSGRIIVNSKSNSSELIGSPAFNEFGELVGFIVDSKLNEIELIPTHKLKLHIENKGILEFLFKSQTERSIENYKAIIWEIIPLKM